MAGNATRPGSEMALTVTRRALHDPDGDVDYWLGRPPAERLAAVETLRRMVFGLDDAPRSRLQRVCRVVRRR